MKKTRENLIFSTLSIALVFMVGMAMTFFNSSKADAESTTYIVDTTGNGCGNSCAELYAYLETINSNNNASSTTNTNNSNSGSGSSTSTAPTNNAGGSTAYDNYVQYPYQIYSYWQPVATSTTNTGLTNYTKYPYQVYNTYKPSYTSSSNSAYYPQPVYVTYNSDKSASSQVNQYKQTSAYGYNSYGTASTGNTSGTGGFVITSIIK